MSIPAIYGPDRILPVAPIKSALVAPPPADTTMVTDALTQPPQPPRFPWLSQLSQQLEANAAHGPAFAPAPVLGDNLDKAA